MDSAENIFALFILGAIAVFAMLMLPDGGGKDVALTVAGSIGGYIVKAVRTPPTVGQG